MPGLARNTDPTTSHIAASRVNVKKLNQIFVDIVKNRGSNGATSKEIAGIAGKQLNSISPRSALLKRKGLIKDSGKRRNNCTVWVEGDGVAELDLSKVPKLPLPGIEFFCWRNDVAQFLKRFENPGCLCDTNYICLNCTAKELLERLK